MPVIKDHASRETVRFTFTEAQMVSITLDDDGGSEPQQIAACLLNLSPQGAKLAIPDELPTGKSFRLKITVPQFALDFFVSAKVCWTASDGESGSVIGCQFDPGIPNGMLGCLAAGSSLDRRGSSREKTKTKLEIVREGARPSAKEKVLLHNYSVGGFCIESWQPMNLGGRFRIVSEKQDVVVDATTHWLIKHSGVYTLGCGYVEQGGSDQLEAVLAAM